MNIIDLLKTELEQEATTTRKMLALVPPAKFEWAPHQKSMKLKSLAVHLAELPGWITMAIDTDEINFDENTWKPTEVANEAELADLLEKNLESARTALTRASVEQLADPWTMRSGGQVLFTWTKYETIRHALAQTIHHRAQLGVYLRLLNIPIPASYGPSADDPGM